MLSINIKTHYILIKEGNRNEIKKIPITKAQYTLYKEELQAAKHNALFEIHDIDTQELLYDGRANKVEGFEEIKVDPKYAGSVWICSFGTRHPLSTGGNCDCSEKYNTMGITFKDEIEKLGYKVNGISDITEQMRDHYLRDREL